MPGGALLWLKEENKVEVTEKEIVIRTYDPSLASAVAEMWNCSREGWGGHSDVQTEEQVRAQEANSTNIYTYLAMEGDRVVGYCGLSEYREDEGALYIPLLNVRDDYHGRKIGKKLLLTALEETVKRKWPRLDLYTWPGNTKAVPLYKKCGFFWENRDDTVHLMNFLPTVRSTELFSAFFEQVDWYADSIREIKTEPDGKKENGFDFYTYEWGKDEHYLQVQFEKTGRGIRSCKTNEYEVMMVIEHHHCVYGKTYPVNFIVKNTSDDTIHIDITGIEQKNIHFHYEEEVTVQAGSEVTLQSHFTVLERHEDQMKMQTHPAVEANIRVNGSAVTMKTGVLCKAPVSISGKMIGSQSFLQQLDKAYIQVENNTKSPVSVYFELPENKNVQFENREYDVHLEEKEKRVIPLSYQLEGPAFYRKTLRVEATFPEHGKKENVTFDQELSFSMNVMGAGVYGECKKYIHLYYGLHHVALKKEDNSVLIERGRFNNGDYLLFYPRLGEPFSEEFSKMKPKDVSFFEENTKIGVAISYPSQEFPGVTVVRMLELTADGMMSQYFIVENHGEQMLEGLRLNEPFMFDLSETVIPYEGKWIHNKGTYNSEVNSWDEGKVSENWLFSNYKGWPAALIWDSKLKLHFHDWHILYFEHKFPIIASGDSVTTSATTFSIGTLHSVEEVRNYAGRKQNLTKWDPENVLRWGTKDRNPFIQKETVLFFDQRLSRSSDVSLEASFGNGEVISETIWTSEQAKRTWEVKTSFSSHREPVLANLTGRLSGLGFTKSTLLFPVTNEAVSYNEGQENDHSVLELDNGIFSVKAAPGFYPAVYSLKKNGIEWLASSFPEPGPKSWWNPWIGGICPTLPGLTARSVLQQNSQGQFVSLFDQHNNEWSAIKQSYTVDDHPDYKGVKIHHYAFVLPGVPVLGAMIEIEQHTGTYWPDQKVVHGFNINPGSELGDVSAQLDNNRSPTYSHHAHEQHMDGFSQLTISKAGVDDKLIILSEQSSKGLELYMNQDVILAASKRNFPLNDGELFRSDPMFFVLNKTDVPLEALRDLRSLRFDSDRNRKD